ncbi:MAG TPA: hypothetical protein VMM76_10470 [Pirellulaceae bacterium]|nr:hypothetical protein [Pirellulaceae bacterium]
MACGKRRHQIIADRKLQGALLVHTAIYWFYCLFSVVLIAVCWIIFTKQPETTTELFTQLWLNCGPALLGSVLLLPLVLLDCLRLSSRFVGPIVRLQRVMRELAAGESPPEFSLRQGDYWAEFAENMNIVMQRLRQADAPSPATAFTVPELDSRDPHSNLANSDVNSAVASPLIVPLDDGSLAQSMYSDLSS